MKNDLFSIGPFTVHGYGLMIAIGVLSAYYMVRPHQGTSVDGRRFSSALQTAGGRFPVLAENQRRGRRPYRGTVPLSYDGTESPEPQSQGSNTAKAHLIFVQNIDFLCLLSGQIHSRCYSLSERCFMVCDVSTGGSG